MNAPTEKPAAWDLLVTADWGLLYDGSDHYVQPNAAVGVRGATIVFAGCTDELPKGVRATEVRHLGDAVITPGLIDLNAVCDVDHAILDTFSDPETSLGHLWSAEWFARRRRDALSPDDRLAGRTWAMAQLLRHGVTTMMPIASEIHREWAEELDDSIAWAEVAERMGIRAFMGPSFRSGVVVNAGGARAVEWDRGEGRRGWKMAVDFLDARGPGHGLVQGALLPCRIETLDDELLRLVANARRDGIPVKLHATQSPFEEQEILRRHGRTSLSHLDAIGMLGPGFFLPHATTTDDMATLADGGTTVVHCPLISARGGSFPSLAAWRSAGVRWALGSDTFPPDLVRAMETSRQISGLLDEDATPASDYWRAATTVGADALGRPDLGRLRAGATADIAVFSFTDSCTGVATDPLRRLMFNGGARDCALTVVDGRIVHEGGAVRGEDMGALKRHANRIFSIQRTAYRERDERHRSPDELFPDVFPGRGLQHRVAAAVGGSPVHHEEGAYR